MKNSKLLGRRVPVGAPDVQFAAPPGSTKKERTKSRKVQDGLLISGRIGVIKKGT